MTWSLENYLTNGVDFTHIRRILCRFVGHISESYQKKCWLFPGFQDFDWKHWPLTKTLDTNPNFLSLRQWCTRGMAGVTFCLDKPQEWPEALEGLEQFGLTHGDGSI